MTFVFCTLQTESYKTRILIPREEKKEKMKEEEFLRFQGPAWKGEGHELGVSVVKETIWSGAGNELGVKCKQNIKRVEE